MTPMQTWMRRTLTSALAVLVAGTLAVSLPEATTARAVTPLTADVAADVAVDGPGADAPAPEPGGTATPPPSGTSTSTPDVTPSETPNASPSASATPSDSPSGTAAPKAPKPPKPPTGRIIGRVVTPSGAGIGKSRVVLFDSDWNYVRETTARSTGRFTFSGVAPGTYRLQGQDGRPAWRLERLALVDKKVRVHAHRDTTSSITLRKGAFLTGKVTRGKNDKGAARALVRATDAYGRSFEVKANNKGEFALGGLPPGSYSLWGYDSAKRWTGRSVKVGKLKRGKGKDLKVPMRTRAGGINGFVLEGGQLARGTTYVTAINRSTGQWWVRKVKDGDLSLPGLAPGRYTFVISGNARWAERTVRSRTKVGSGRTKQVTLRLTKRK